MKHRRIYYDRRGYGNASTSTKKPTDDYAANLLIVGDFNTIRKFWSYMNNIKLPSAMVINCNVHIFKQGISPTWEVCVIIRVIQS